MENPEATWKLEIFDFHDFLRFTLVFKVMSVVSIEVKFIFH